MSEASSPIGPSSSSSPAVPSTSRSEQARKAIVVQLDAFRLLHTLQMKAEPRMDLSYIATAAIVSAFSSAQGETAIRNLALALMRRDFDQLT